MASLLYGIRAYAAEGYAPDAILTKLSELLSVETTGHFATVLCVLVDLARHQITMASAGHLPPLLLRPDGAAFVSCPVGLPIGVSPTIAYDSAIIDIPENGALMAFTDGLVERRGESLEAGLARLRDMADLNAHSTLEGLISAVVHGLVGSTGEDDTVVLGARWSN